jgi:hypothetical protein
VKSYFFLIIVFLFSNQVFADEQRPFTLRLVNQESDLYTFQVINQSDSEITIERIDGG